MDTAMDTAVVVGTIGLLVWLVCGREERKAWWRRP